MKNKHSMLLNQLRPLRPRKTSNNTSHRVKSLVPKGSAETPGWRQMFAFHQLLVFYLDTVTLIKSWLTGSHMMKAGIFKQDLSNPDLRKRSVRTCDSSVPITSLHVAAGDRAAPLQPITRSRTTWTFQRWTSGRK